MTMNEAITSDRLLKWMPVIVLVAAVAAGAAVGQFQIKAIAEDMVVVEKDIDGLEGDVTGLNLFIVQQQSAQSLVIQDLARDVEVIRDGLEAQQKQGEKLDQVLDLLLQNGGLNP